MTPLRAQTASAIVIGNELLSGKVQESNLLELSRVLRTLGIRLVKAVIVPDEVPVIRAEVESLSKASDVVFTSGGVGPTHDDVTVEAVAQAFGVEAVVHPTLEKLLRESYGERLGDAHLRMALVPRGATLVSVSDIKWPTTLMHNVFMLPGVPEIFRMKLDAVRAHVTGPQPFVSRAVFLGLEEAEIKDALDAVVAAHPGVEIGSYPKWFEPRYRTKVTFDARDASAVDAALSDFVTRCDPSSVVHVE
ncbi:MAG: molybdopterin-binding protein [Pseudomonadota bacterium]|nr:MAG: competence/damage-inducible protein A [Pseudomonadota bacterium]